jgi:hypothetical protein
MKIKETEYIRVNDELITDEMKRESATVYVHNGDIYKIVDSSAFIPVTEFTNVKLNDKYKYHSYPTVFVKKPTSVYEALCLTKSYRINNGNK